VNDLIQLGPLWKLQLGLRHDRIETLGYADAVFTVGDRQQESKTTPSIGVVWQPTATRAYFASFTRSFLPQFGRNRLGQILQPEEGRSVEVGLKHEILERRLALTASLFQIDKSNILQTDPLDPCCNINGGSARSRGGEIELQGRPWAGGEIQLGVGLADARWTLSNSFPVGARLPGASPVTATAALKQRTGDHVMPWLPAGSWLSGTVSYGSAREWTPLTDPVRLPAYVRLDLGVGLALGSDAEVQFNVKNVLDDRTVQANGYGLVAPDVPRTFGVTLRWAMGR
jgi:outer membrane receptor protein involved in Fe transport